jgi:hypothetical protein
MKLCKEHRLPQPCPECFRAEIAYWKQSYRMERVFRKDVMKELIKALKKLKKLGVTV